MTKKLKIWEYPSREVSGDLTHPNRFFGNLEYRERRQSWEELEKYIQTSAKEILENNTPIRENV